MINLKTTNYYQTTLSFKNIPLNQKAQDIQSKESKDIETIRVFGRDLTNLSLLTDINDFTNKSGLIKGIDLLKYDQANKSKRNKLIIKRIRELKSIQRSKEEAKQKIVQSQIPNYIQPLNKSSTKTATSLHSESSEIKRIVHLDNPQCVPEYQYEILDHYKCLDWENNSIDSNYMTKQNDINERMRSILIDWLVEVHQKYKFLSETLYLTVNIIDKYLSKQMIDRKNLQLLGITSLFISGKYEEIYPPELKHYIIITDNAYQKQDVINMERSILKTLQFDFAIPSSFRYLELIMHFIQFDNSEVIMSQFILELCLIDYNMLTYSNGVLAVSVLCLVRKMMSVETMQYEDIMKMFNYDRTIINKCMREQYALYNKETQNYCNSDSSIHNDNSKEIELKAIQNKYMKKLYFEPINVKLKFSHIQTEDCIVI